MHSTLTNFHLKYFVLRCMWTKQWTVLWSNRFLLCTSGLKQMSGKLRCLNAQFYPVLALTNEREKWIQISCKHADTFDKKPSNEKWFSIWWTRDKRCMWTKQWTVLRSNRFLLCTSGLKQMSGKLRCLNAQFYPVLALTNEREKWIQISCKHADTFDKKPSNEKWFSIWWNRDKNKI